MTADDWVKVIGSVAGALVLVLTAIGALWVKVHEYRREVNGKMQQLLDVTREAGEAHGRATPDAPPPEPTPATTP